VPPIEQRSIAELCLDRPLGRTEESAAPQPMDTLTLETRPISGIPLYEPPDPADRPRILIVDDSPDVVLEPLAISLQAHYAKALDVRFWEAGKDDETLLAHLDDLANATPPWRPQVIVLDIHLKGGQTSLDYLQALRTRKGLASMAVVLATADHKQTLDLHYQAEQRSTSAEWLSQAKIYEPEFVLYGKEGSRNFLARIGESVSSWVQTARRRAWQKLLEMVAEKLDGELKTPAQIHALGQLISDYAHDELGVDEAFARWRKDGGKYSRIAHSGETTHTQHGDETTVAEVPLLQEVLENRRKALIKAQLATNELGRFQPVAGYRFLGIGAHLDGRPYGFIALYRKPTGPKFDPEIDGKQLEILGRLLAAALGRATAIKRTKERQQALLDFAQTLAQARSENEVYQRLAEFLHQEIHGAKNDESKVAIAKIAFRSGILECVRPTQGLAAKSCNLPIFIEGEREGVCAKTVREKKAFLIDDVTVKEPDTDTDTGINWPEIYVESTPNIRSELCVPLLISGAAIGVVNLEHKAVGRYKDHDLNFVQSAVNLACQVIDNLRTGRFAEDTLEFAEKYTTLSAQAAEEQLRNKLHDFCHFSALAILEPTDPNDLTKVWRLVGDIDLRLDNGSKKALTDDLENINGWEDTWLLKLCHQAAWEDKIGAAFTNDSKDFQSIALGTQSGKPVTQKADAILWLRDGTAPPHRVMLLLWVFPPPIGDNELRALGRFARLFASLESQQDRVRSLRDEVMMKDQAAAMGHVMQHFRHRLVNETGVMNGLVELMESDVQKHDCEAISKSLVRLKNAVQKTADSFDKARGYVKVPKPESCRIRRVLDQARNDLSNRLSCISVQDEQVSQVQTCWTDPIIASLILYSLLENAADALKDTANPQIRLSTRQQDGGVVLRIEDNGRGIPEANRSKLFTFGFTTKSGSLGSALAFARLRVGQLEGNLHLAAEQPFAGAAFELWLPADEGRWALATATRT